MKIGDISALYQINNEMNLLLNLFLVLGYFKLKEYKNARAQSQEYIDKLGKSSAFGAEIPFTLRYLSTISLYYCEKETNTKNKN